jgi:hypothetical protein
MAGKTKLSATPNSVRSRARSQKLRMTPVSEARMPQAMRAMKMRRRVLLRFA